MNGPTFSLEEPTFSLEEPTFSLEETVRLRPCEPGDVNALHRVLLDPEIRRYLLDGEAVSRGFAEEAVADSQRDFRDGRAGFWLIEDSGEVVGFAGFRDFFDPPRHQLLFGLLPSCWGRGLATRSAERILDHVFADGRRRVEAAADALNEASLRVLDRLAFRRFLPADEALRRGDFGETLFFELFAETWRTRRHGDRGEASAERGRRRPGPRVVFLCTHNSARSQMAEALFRHHWGDNRVGLRSFSAGVEATGMHELAAEALRRVGIDADRQVSKTVDTLRGELTPEDEKEASSLPLFDIVVTVCDNAREACPYLPARILNLHRSFEDPSAVEGSREERLAAFERIRDEIRQWLEDEVPGWLQRSEEGASASG